MKGYDLPYQANSQLNSLEERDTQSGSYKADSSYSADFSVWKVDDGKKWWDSLWRESRGEVLQEVYGKQWVFEEILKTAKVDPLGEDFSNSCYFLTLLDIVNCIRQDRYRDKVNGK
jgi:hypothetical protein